MTATYLYFMADAFIAERYYPMVTLTDTISYAEFITGITGMTQALVNTVMRRPFANSLHG